MTLWACRSRAWARKAREAWYRSAIRCRLEQARHEGIRVPPRLPPGDETER